MKEKLYTFTFSQLLQFLSEYVGASFDDSGEESLRQLLDELDKKGEVEIEQRS